mgnify:CR=1 FL=1
MFTPFRKKWIQAVKERGGIDCLRKPRVQKELAIKADPVPAVAAGFDGLKRPDLWKAGEQKVQTLLRKFVRERLAGYHEHRDSPARDATSILSPYLALGILSPGQCLSQALGINGGRLDGGQEGAVTWITEIGRAHV